MSLRADAVSRVRSGVHSGRPPGVLVALGRAVTHLVLAVAMLLAHGAPATADEGFLERDNSTIDFSDDWGMFLSYQFLPWAEFIVDGGKFQFVRARLLFSIPLETS